MSLSAALKGDFCVVSHWWEVDRGHNSYPADHSANMQRHGELSNVMLQSSPDGAFRCPRALHTPRAHVPKLVAGEDKGDVPLSKDQAP